MLICFNSPTIKAPLNLGLDYTGGTQIILERSCNDDCIQLNTCNIRQPINQINDNIRSIFNRINLSDITH